MEREEPILAVSHDSDDHGGQFIGSTDGTPENGRIILLSEAVGLDPSVLQLADLPAGCHAWWDSPDEPWIREADSDVTPTI